MLHYSTSRVDQHVPRNEFDKYIHLSSHNPDPPLGSKISGVRKSENWGTQFILYHLPPVGDGDPAFPSGDLTMEWFCDLLEVGFGER